MALAKQHAARRSKSRKQKNGEGIKNALQTPSAGILGRSARRKAKESQSTATKLPNLVKNKSVLYRRRGSPESPIGAHTSSETAIQDDIFAYVEQRYFHGLGLSRLAEPVRQQVRVVSYHTKAPRFISIHAVRLKELERDYVEPQDTTRICHRKKTCTGRCLLGSPCPLPGPPKQTTIKTAHDCSTSNNKYQVQSLVDESTTETAHDCSACNTMRRLLKVKSK